VKKVFLIILSLTIFIPQSWCYMVSTGTYVPYLNKAQVSTSGSTQKYDLNPYIGIGTNFPMTSSQYFLPEFAYSYFMDNASGSRREMVFLHYNFGYVLSPDALLRYGLSTHWYRIIGKGGTTTLDNGTGTTSFANPDKTVTTYFTTLNLGAEYFINSKQNSIRFDLNMMSFKDFDKRVYNYLLTYNFFHY